jgi:glyoxylase-like metal-dependent hydrolase (beta-lactamase superfamily II)
METTLQQQPLVEAFFDQATSTITYVVYDRAGGRAAVIDPVWDYEQKSGRLRTTGVDRVLGFLRQHALGLDWILETHAHADHISAAQYLRKAAGGKIAIGEHIGEVQQTFRKVFNLGETLAVDGTQFDHLFAPDETFMIGTLEAKALFVPGHTAADMAYQVGDAVFVGDTLFMPDVGTARCDFPGGDARQLYRSLRQILALPADTRLYMCHDYPASPRPPQWLSTVAEQRRHNIHVHDGVSEEAFVAMRQARDATLEMPVLIIPSIQINIRAGELPPPEANGVSYLKTPLNLLGRA